MQNRKKRLSAFLFILLILTLPSVENTTEIAWSDESPLVEQTGDDENPSITQTIDGTIWVVWHSVRGGNYDIYCKTSDDGGDNWSSDTRLTNNTSVDKAPSITQTADGKIWVVLASNRTGNYDIFYKTSSDGGDNWSDEEQLPIEDPNYDFDSSPSITQIANGTIWVVWQSDRIWVNVPGEGNIPQDDIFYKTSSDGGANWSADIQLTNSTKDDTDPSIIQTTDSKIWVTWVSNKHDGRDIFYKTSSDGGANWSADIQLTEYEGDDWAPSITQTIYDTIWVVWHSPREGNWDIYYKTSSDGINWTTDKRLTADLDADVTPSITQADDKIWVVWASNRAGDYDLWYMTAIVMGVHDIAITAVTSNSTSVFRGETVLIEVAIVNEGNVSETLDVTVYAYEDDAVIGDEITVGTQTATDLAPYNSTTLAFNWITSGVLPRDYNISAYAWPVQGETDLTDNSLTNGVIQIRKFLGDLDYDVDVDIDDHTLFVGSYPSSIGDPRYNPDADLDYDDDIDEDDHDLFRAFLGVSDPTADVTGDGKVTGGDYVFFVGRWGSYVGSQGYSSSIDFDDDGYVDDDDWLVFFAYYLMALRYKVGLTNYT